LAGGGRRFAQRTCEQVFGWNAKAMRQSLEPISRDPWHRIVLNAADITSCNSLPEGGTPVRHLGKRKILLFANAAHELPDAFYKRYTHAIRLSQLKRSLGQAPARNEVRILISKSIFASDTFRARLVPRKNSS